MRFTATMVLLPLLLAGCSSPSIRTAPPLTPDSKPRDSEIETTISDAQDVAVENAIDSSEQPAAIKDAWLQLVQDFSWPIELNAAVRREIRLLTRHPRGFMRASRYAEPFLWHIASTLARRGLPAELAMLPMIESRYRAVANSPNGASGLWQFMPATGRHLGLQESRWYDARNDVVASTRAALDYLEKLNEKFDGDWLLTLAAYNCGELTVQRAMAKNAGADYWSIAEDLPLETQSHVPRLLAAVAIVASPATYGVTLHHIPNAPYFVAVDLGGPADLRHFDQAESLQIPAFKRLNAAFKRPYTGPNGPFRILVPIDAEDAAIALVNELPAERTVPQTIHVVRAGDTLSGIAAHYGVSVDDLRRENQISGSLLKIGRDLVISGVAPDSNGTPPAPTAEAAVHHTVQPGDSLWTIARRFKISVTQLCQWNNLPRRKVLHPGQLLIVANPPAAGVRNI